MCESATCGGGAHRRTCALGAAGATNARKTPKFVVKSRPHTPNERQSPVESLSSVSSVTTRNRRVPTAKPELMLDIARLSLSHIPSRGIPANARHRRPHRKSDPWRYWPLDVLRTSLRADGYSRWRQTFHGAGPDVALPTKQRCGGRRTHSYPTAAVG